MSSRIAEVLVDLGDEVAALPLGSAREVRRKGRARRRNRAVGAAIVVVAVTLGSAVTGAVSLPITNRGVSDPGAQATAPDPTVTCDGGSVVLRGSPGARPTSGRYVTVFFANDATPEQLTAVGNTLRSSPLVESFHFEDHSAAYARFTQIYACALQFVDSVTPDSLPESFRVTLRSVSGVMPLADELERMPGVDAVVSNSRPG
jgi:hypothetical protein